MQVSDAELAALDMHRQIDLAASAQILDIAVTAMLWPARNGSSSFLADLLFDIVASRADMHASRLWRVRNDAIHVGAGGNELALALVPRGKNFGRGCAAEDSWVDEAGKPYARDASPIISNASSGLADQIGTYCRLEQKMPSKSQIAFAAFGYSSSRKPPPLDLSKMPVKPQSWRSSG
jgi:hypothetical protein